ncbi:MAG TPA: peptide chain release factor N(5)-glutamine methyltransferase [Vicinamibacterales bacterium]|nr:peptide chain release factor N(5)-glutamine methyltransferase [Acidobacteriota bacterium]HOC17833.1 peptide chain release factor N(5)-glutamine methyltransferase [Vicinamibacterales bacterium]
MAASPDSPATPRQLAALGRARLAGAGIEPGEAAMDAELLLREALGGWDRARFLAHQDDPATERTGPAFEALIERRARREPISLVLGRREFWGLEFRVTRDVLTPRPETELVVEEALACAATLPRRASVADVGTGSGCLAVSLAIELPAASVLATDVSAAALEVARENAARHGVAGRITFERASLLGGAAGLALVVSNPPYIPTRDIETLPPEVRLHEPRAALDGGPDGLDVVRALLAAALEALMPGGWLVFEFGDGQAQAVQAAVASSPLEMVRIRADLQGIPRTAAVRRP